MHLETLEPQFLTLNKHYDFLAFIRSNNFIVKLINKKQKKL